MAGNRMLKFVTVKRDMPPKRAAVERRDDFGEIYREFAAEKAAEQAGRCSQCGVPYCQTHCPLHNNIPDWLKLTAEGRLREAYELSQATNTFPEICGRICPQDRLCEGNCVIEQSGHGTVTIGAVEKYITDTAWEAGLGAAAAPLRRAAGERRHHRRGARRAGGGRHAAAARLPGDRLRPPRPGRRAAGLWHPRVQAGEGGGDAAQRPARGRRRQLPAELQRRRGCRLRRYPGKPRRGADRHWRLQVTRPRRPRLGARRHRAGDRLPDRLEPQGLRRRGARVRTRASWTPRASASW